MPTPKPLEFQGVSGFLPAEKVQGFSVDAKPGFRPFTRF